MTLPRDGNPDQRSIFNISYGAATCLIHAIAAEEHGWKQVRIASKISRIDADQEEFGDGKWFG
jgi:hypothetical protein